MVQTVYLPDGKCMTEFGYSGVMDIVKEYAGKDIRDYIDDIVRDRDEISGKLDMIEDDVDDLEQQADEYNGILHEIVRLCREFRQKYESEMPDREDLTEFIGSVFDKAYEMI